MTTHLEGEIGLHKHHHDSRGGGDYKSDNVVVCEQSLQLLAYAFVEGNLMSFPTNPILRWARLRKKAAIFVTRAPLQKLSLFSGHCLQICAQLKIMFTLIAVFWQ